MDHNVNPPIGCTPAILKPHTGGQLPYSNIKIKIKCECSSLYKILALHQIIKRIFHLGRAFLLFDNNEVQEIKSAGPF